MKRTQQIVQWLSRWPLYLATIVSVAVVIVATLMPSAYVPKVQTFFGFDKIVHFLMFGIVASTMMFDEGRRRDVISFSLLVVAAMLSSGLGLLCEYLQAVMNVGRSFDWGDFVADSMGAVIVPLIFWKFLGRMIQDYNLSIVEVSGLCGDLMRIKELYYSSFPAKERRPWNDLVTKLLDAETPFSVYRIFSRGRFVGFISWWKLGEMRYVEHFAVLAERRGGGIGAKALKLFVDKEAEPVVLEVEPAEYDEDASRRIGFYKRCGFILHDDFDYVQPPYSPDLPSVRLTLMTSDADVNLEEATSKLHRFVYGR